MSHAAPSPVSGRDLRIDLLRGIALVMIFINHIPGNILEDYTSRNFGFSDAAEAFVLLSGISAGLAYAPWRSRRGGDSSAFRPWARALTLWWVQALVAVSIYLLLAATARMAGVAEMAAARNVAPMLEQPWDLLLPLLLMAYQFNCADILPLYVLFLLATPGLIFTGARWPLVLMAASAALWLAAGWNSVNLRTWPIDGSWFFNPLSWQLLFVAGLLTGLAKSRGAALLPVRWWAIVPAMAFLAFSAIWMLTPDLADRGYSSLWDLQQKLDTPDFITSFDKTYLAPIRVLHILALAYVLSAWPLLHRIANSRWSSALTAMGRNALPVFATGTVLGYVIQVIREIFLTPPIFDLALIAAGINLTLLAALMSERASKRRMRR